MQTFFFRFWHLNNYFVEVIMFEDIRCSLSVSAMVQGPDLAQHFWWNNKQPKTFHSGFDFPQVEFTEVQAKRN